MASNALFFGWNRSLPGRERVSAAHFEEFTKYVIDLQQNGAIQSFETVFLDSHGGDMNGFFLIRGDSTRLDALVASEEWVSHMIRAALHLEGVGSIRGITGQAVMDRMELWTKNIPA